MSYLPSFKGRSGTEEAEANKANNFLEKELTHYPHFMRVSIVPHFTGLSKRMGAKFGEGSSVRANWLRIGCPKKVCNRKEGNSNRGHLFCTSL